MNHEQIISIIRTIVPAIVGLIIAQLAKAGLEIDQAALTVVFDGLIIGLYYILVRWAESHRSQFGWLLGAPHQPAYPTTGER